MKAPLPMRIWFALMAGFMWVGIYFTDFSTVNWLLYIPATGLTIASSIGICPTQIAIAKLFGTKHKTLNLND